MPYFRRYGGYGYGRRYRRWYGRRGWTRSWRGRSMSRRTANGTRTMSMVIPVENTMTCVIPSGSYNSVVCGIEPWWYNPSNANPQLLNASLFTTDLYRTYAHLYDDVKIDWMSCEIGVLDTVGSGGTFSAVRLWTSVDRRIVRTDLSNAPTANQVRTSSSAQGTLMVNNSRAVTRRYIAASDLAERITFHDCTQNVAAADNVYDQSWYNSGYSVPFFSPGLFFFFEVSAAPAEQKGISLSIRVKYGVTFRNAKFGLSQGAGSKDVEMEVDPVATKKAGKIVEKPVYVGMLKSAIGRLSLNVSDGVEEYENGDASLDEDLNYVYEKVGEEEFRKLFKDFYDDELLTLGLVKKEVMDDDPTELVKDTKS